MENWIRRIINEEIEKVLNEDGEGGATSTQSVMQGGGSNPSAGTYDVPMGSVQRRDIYAPTRKRSNDFKNGSMCCQHASDENNGTINKKKASK